MAGCKIIFCKSCNWTEAYSRTIRISRTKTAGHKILNISNIYKTKLILTLMSLL